MTTIKFQYKDELLSSCAQLGIGCKDLFLQHQKHYKRRGTASQEQYETFLRNVEFIYNHNTYSVDSEHRVELNHFSDQLYRNLSFFEHDEFYKDDEFLNISLTILKNTKRNSDEMKGEEHKNIQKLYNRGNDGSIDPASALTFANARDFEFQTDKDDYRTHLNWSTHHNPDGVPIVHPSIDQGKCGSCWAFAAIGSVEAIASRRAAYNVYNSMVEQKSRRHAIKSAQRAEKRAHRVANLSTQELINCDSSNRGCIGGNPVTAFPFINKFGLVSNADYPYIGKDRKCHKKMIKLPIATSDSWGVLKSNDEETMERTLRYVGPIAAAIHGSSKSFIHYKSGIFRGECKTTPNHALLIVGYGQEKTKKGVLKYWIARNSWGTAWGENGFIRIERSDSHGDKGVCGVARFPSVAIGATLIQDINKWQSGSNPNDKMVTQSLLSLSSTQSILVKPKPIICSNRVVSYIVACAIIIVIGIVVILYRHFSRSRRLDLSRQTQFRDYGSINVPLTRS